LGFVAANRKLACLAATVLASWALCAAALDKDAAIDVAKARLKDKCGSTTSCTFTAKAEKDKWHVRADFAKAGSPQGKPSAYAGGHAVFIIDQSGKVIGQVEGAGARRSQANTIAANPGPKTEGTPRAAFRCDGRTHCSQMSSCAEATYFLKNCPGVKMDGNNDGVPCERQWCR
jgi:hypothetical protein